MLWNIGHWALVLPLRAGRTRVRLSRSAQLKITGDGCHLSFVIRPWQGFQACLRFVT
ncbi:hypothetical protein LC605_04155 [Nostoc sp. CHAB 5836]|uniref:hypothetical protein n=1 Tax=Nostoc sp. CHAB 5836 TaxID=2780404 RepID=UPI001E2F41FE|nr:hypothetical protein [Nostoc sp. CHAB 5836]MCC5614282.1 hypothetical protein [Nostoc sp. CHAB 5836]